MASEITEEEATMHERPSHEQRRVLGELSHDNARRGERGGFSRSFKPWLDRNQVFDILQKPVHVQADACHRYAIRKRRNAKEKSNNRGSEAVASTMTIGGDNVQLSLPENLQIQVGSMI